MLISDFFMFYNLSSVILNHLQETEKEVPAAKMMFDF